MKQNKLKLEFLFYTITFRFAQIVSNFHSLVGVLAELKNFDMQVI
jgi:hypothetical protein